MLTLATARSGLALTRRGGPYPYGGCGAGRLYERPTTAEAFY